MSLPMKLNVKYIAQSHSCSVKLFLCLTENHAMKVYWGVEVELHAFLTSTLDGSEWLASRPAHSTPGAHWIRGWVGPRTGLDAVVNRKISGSRFHY
jgi:hypothetical protein